MKLCHGRESLKHLMPKRRNVNPVLEGLLDHYMHNAISPDNPPGGISKCLIEFCFLSGEEHMEFGSLDLLIRVQMMEMVMGSQQFLYNYKKEAISSIIISA